MSFKLHKPCYAHKVHYPPANCASNINYLVFGSNKDFFKCKTYVRSQGPPKFCRKCCIYTLYIITKLICQKSAKKFSFFCKIRDLRSQGLFSNLQNGRKLKQLCSHYIILLVISKPNVHYSQFLSNILCFLCYFCLINQYITSNRA